MILIWWEMHIVHVLLNTAFGNVYLLFKKRMLKCTGYKYEESKMNVLWIYVVALILIMMLSQSGLRSKGRVTREVGVDEVGVEKDRASGGVGGRRKL